MENGCVKFAFAALATLAVLLSGCTANQDTADAEEPLREITPGMGTPIQAADWDGHVAAAIQSGSRCGIAVSPNYETGEPGSPTFVDVYEDNGYLLYTAIIWDEDRWQFPTAPEEYYRTLAVCVSGEYYDYEGRAQVAIRDPDQLSYLAL